MWFFQSQAKPGKGKATTANIPIVPHEQAALAPKHSGKAPRAPHNGENDNPTGLHSQKRASMEESGFRSASEGQTGGSKSSCIVGVAREPVSPFIYAFDKQCSNTTLTAGQDRVREGTTSSNRTPPSSSEISSCPDASGEVCQQDNAQCIGQHESTGEVGGDESIVRSPSTGEPVFGTVVGRETNTLRIHSPLLLNAMRIPPINKPALPPTPTSLREPYEWVFHNRKRLLSINQGDAGQHAKLLLDFVRKEHSSTWYKLNEIDASSWTNISFDDLWLLYKPGSTVFTKDDGGWRAYKIGTVESCRLSEKEDFRMNCYYLDFDETGNWLVPRLEVFSISRFSSERSIQTLDILPDKYVRSEEHLREKLSERGEKYWSYRRRPFYQEYRGDAWPQTVQNGPVKVVVDYATASKHEWDRGRGPSRIYDSACRGCLGEGLDLRPHPQGSPHDPDACARKDAVDTDGDEDKFYEQLSFCPSKIWAFSLRHMTWKMVKPEHLQQVAPRPQALDRLWLKSDDKEFLGNIIRTHRGDKQFHPSIVSETTGSLKILLHGEPGTGKTLTAECLSEEFGVPLYTVNFGDLGVEPDVLGQRLEEAFLRAANWKAILLLDHAGTLIAKRHSNWTFHHNSSVSVFLRHLDHSKGLILITSTPSPLGLDPDFESRLNMLLPFPNFTFEAQKFVWRKLIDSLQGPDDFSKMPLIDFINNELPNLDDGAYAQMNGRQITNCFTAALFHAHGSINSDGNNLTSRHIKEILRLGKEFKDYLAQIEKKSDNRAMWWGS